MSSFAILADIHGNADALEAVLADMAARGVTEAVTLGDHFSGPLDAAGTARILLERQFPSIRGNHDRCLVEQRPEAMGLSDQQAFAQLEPAHLDWLRSLPPRLTVQGDVFLCHGTPVSDQSYWMERVEPDGRVRAATAEEAELPAAGIRAGLILCAHTHIPRMMRLSGGRLLVNPGSVGCPAYEDDTPVPHRMETGTPDAAYAIATKAAAGWEVTLCRVAYDPARMAALAAARGRDSWRQALVSGRIGTGEPHPRD